MFYCKMLINLSGQNGDISKCDYTYIIICIMYMNGVLNVDAGVQ